MFLINNALALFGLGALIIKVKSVIEEKEEIEKLKAEGRKELKERFGWK